MENLEPIHHEHIAMYSLDSGKIVSGNHELKVGINAILNII